MLEHALKGNKKYWSWLFFLGFVILVGFYFYMKQFSYGLGLTGMSRNVSWGLYIAQFTFIVGVAASAVMVVLPYYLHDYKKFGKITILGEFLAISSCVMCITFVFVDLGQPLRLVNIFLYPTFHSLMFWDVIALSGYLIINVIITRVTLGAEHKQIAPPKWIKPIIILSIPWAVSIHTITAFLLSGLSARPFWLTAILAPRFLASAFSAGPALLVVLCLILKRITKFDPGDEAIKKLTKLAQDYDLTWERNWASFNLETIYQKLGNKKQEEYYIKKNIRNNPDSPYFYAHLGWFYFREGKYKEALECVKQAEKRGKYKNLMHLKDLIYAKILLEEDRNRN